jgi:hypothetical protein
MHENCLPESFAYSIHVAGVEFLRPEHGASWVQYPGSIGMLNKSQLGILILR